MQSRPFAQSLASATSVVLATIMLAACGPDSSASPQAAASNASARPDEPAQTPDSAAPLPRASTSTENANTADNAADFASNAVASVQASLAADSKQVAPIMSYAPGDDPPSAHTGTDSGSTATTSQ